MVGQEVPRMRSVIMNEQEGYSGLFYIMLIVGIVGVLGFVIVAATAGS
jgi:hypothetical protein